MNNFVYLIATNPYVQIAAAIITTITVVQYTTRVLRFLLRVYSATLADGAGGAWDQIKSKRRDAYKQAASDLHILLLAISYKVMHSILLFVLIWIITTTLYSTIDIISIVRSTMIAVDVFFVIGLSLRIIDLWYYIIAVRDIRVTMISAEAEVER